MSPARKRRRVVDGASGILPGRSPGRRPGPEGGARDARRRERTEAIAGAALGLFLARGIESVSVDDIARAAGIAKGSFYTYFHDQADLVGALLAPMREGLRVALERCEVTLRDARTTVELRSAYTVVAADAAAVILGRSDIARLYLQECRSPAVGARVPIVALADEMRGAALRLTHLAHASGLLRSVAPRVTAAAVLGASEHLLHRFLAGDDLGDPSEAIEALVTMVVEGLLGPGAPASRQRA